MLVFFLNYVLICKIVMYKALSLFADESKNHLATNYRQSQLCQNVLEELDHVNNNFAQWAEGPNEAVDYATSFLYQVS